MSIGLASVLLYCCAMIIAWFVGMFVPRFSRSRLALFAAMLLLLPGLGLLVGAPIYWIGIDGEESWGFLFISAPAFMLGLVGITLALVNWSRFHPFGFSEEEI